MKIKAFNLIYSQYKIQNQDQQTKILYCYQLFIKYKRRSNKMHLHVLLIFSLCISAKSDMFKLKQWNNNAAHSMLVISVCIYNDNTKFVSGSDDQYVRVWSMITYQKLFQIQLSDVITHVSLHPDDNRIFILDFNSKITVLDPNTYAVLHTSNIYSPGMQGFYLQFFSNNQKYLVGGYDSSVPQFHVFDATTYASIAAEKITSNFAAGLQINVISVSRDKTLVAGVSNQNVSPIQIHIYNIGSKSLLQSFNDNHDRLKWITFSPYRDQFYVTCRDMTLKTYKLNSQTSKYDTSSTVFTSPYGYPNSISAVIKDKLVFTANKFIVFLNIQNQYPSVQFKSEDQKNLFVIDISRDGKYLVSGMETGEITLWQIGTPTTAKDEDIKLLIILGGAIGGFILIVIAVIIVYKCCCVNKMAVLDSSQHQNRQMDNLRDHRGNYNNRTQNSIAAYDNANKSYEFK